MIKVGIRMYFIFLAMAFILDELKLNGSSSVFLSVVSCCVCVCVSESAAGSLCAALSL